MKDSMCPVCNGEMSIDGAFRRYVSGDMSDAYVSDIDKHCCETHWDLLMDLIRKYDEEEGIEAWLDPEEDPF